MFVARRLIPALLLVLALAVSVQAQIEITYTSWQSGGAGREAEEEIVRRFNESQSDIRVTFVPGPWSQALLEEVIVQVAGGVAPDVATLRGITVGPNLEQIAVDLTPFIERDGYDMNRFMPVTHSLAARNGKIYGVPWAFGSMLLYYNDNIFQEAGLAAPQKGWTTDEFAQYARLLTVDRDGDGNPDRWGLDHIHDGHLYLWGQLFGGSFLSDDGSSVAIQDAAFVDALDFATRLANDDRSVRTVGPTNSVWETGETAMVVNWEPYIGSLMTMKHHETFDWRTTYMPRGGGAETSTYAQWHVMAAIKGTKHPEAAWEFIKFYNSDEIQAYLGSMGVEPATVVGRRTFGLEGPLPPGADRMDIYGPILDPPSFRTVAWEVESMSEMWPQLVSMFAGVLKGEEAPRAAVDRLAPVLNARLAAQDK